MQYLSFSLLITGALGAVSQFCVGFEASKKPRELIVKVSNDTSVLLYQFTDTPSSNIPLFIDDEVLESEPNGFGVCTQEKASQGRCDIVGTFLLNFDGAHDDLVNSLVHAGEKVNLTVSEEGIYCAVMYQEGAELSDTTLVEKHSYGYLPLPQYGTMNMLYQLEILLIMTCAVLGVMFLVEKRAYIRAIYQDIFFLLFSKLFLSFQKYGVFGVNNHGGSHRYVRYADFTSLYDELLSLADLPSFFDALARVTFYSTYYKLSVGVFGLQKKKTDKTTMEPLFKTCFLLMLFSGILVSFQQSLELHLPLQLFRFTCIFSQIVLSTVRISMVYIMWEKSKITERELEDPVFAEKYYLSKLCLIWIPLITFVLSFAGERAVMSIISKSFHTLPGEFGSDIQNVSFVSMEPSIDSNYLFALLRNLPEFSMLFVIWALLLIWKPFLIQKTDLASNHNIEENKH